MEHWKCTGSGQQTGSAGKLFQVSLHPARRYVFDAWNTQNGASRCLYLTSYVVLAATYLVTGEDGTMLLVRVVSGLLGAPSILPCPS